MTQQEFLNRYKYSTSKDLLGSGGFGKVYKAYDEILSRRIAIKIAPVQEGRENISLLKEVEIAKKLPHHRNIAHYEDCFRFDSPMGELDYGILQYYADGNLSQLIKAKKLTFLQKEQIAKGIISGIAHLHDNNIVHRDIKSSNVLISTNPNGEYIPKIADFGLSKQFTDTAKSYFSNSFAGGSLLYVAPEQLKGGQIRKNVDLWSMGVMLFELFTGQVPFYPTKDDGTETARKEIIQQIEKAALPNTINNIPQPWQDLIRKCLVVNSNDRLKDTAAVYAIVGGGATFDTFEARDEAETVIEDKRKKERPTRNEKEKEDSKKPLPPWFYPLIGGVVIIGLLLFYFNKNNGSSGAIEPTPTDSVAVKIDTIAPTVPKEDTEEDSEAEVLAAEKSAWEKAKSSRDIIEVKAFLKTYPDGIYADVAKQLLTNLEEAAAQKAAKAKAAEEKKQAASNTKDPFASQMKYIRGGTFQMGSNNGDSNERPVHAVSVSSFKMSKYEVTQKQWRAIMGTNPSDFKGCNNCPVESVSWNDVQDFIRKLNNKIGKRYRLPTEAEWEYAARGGQNYKYAGSNNIGSVVWYDGNSGDKTHPVGQKSPNGYGLYDMSGNVWEWCQDTWHDNYSGAPTNGSAWTSGGDSAIRVLRGGSFNSHSLFCRTADRTSGTPTDRHNCGFRLVLP